MNKKTQYQAGLSSVIIFVVCGLFVYFSGNFINSLNAAINKDGTGGSFEAESKQRTNSARINYITRNVISILKSRHYRPQVINDDFSNRVFEKYFDMLDPERMYFDADDVKKFESYRSALDDQLPKGNADFAYEVFDLYKVVAHTSKPPSSPRSMASFTLTQQAAA